MRAEYSYLLEYARNALEAIESGDSFRAARELKELLYQMGGRSEGPRYAEDGQTGCWIWQGRSLNRKGYAYVRRNGKLQPAHRAMYEEKIGPIPANHDLHHVCRNRLCLNPAHLIPVPKEEHRRIHLNESVVKD